MVTTWYVEHRNGRVRRIPSDDPLALRARAAILAPAGGELVLIEAATGRAVARRLLGDVGHGAVLAGIAGGGLVQTASSDAHLMLFAATLVRESGAGAGEPRVLGSVRWLDPGWQHTGLILESARISWYWPLAGASSGQEIGGWAQVAGGPRVPFLLRVIDAATPGTGAREIVLRAGDAALGVPVLRQASPVPEPTGFSYAAEGALVAGDLQPLRFELA